MPTDLPPIGLMPTKAFKGADNLSDERQPLIVMPFWDAFETPHGTDAHFVTYEPRNTGQALWPRCNKALLPKLRAAGGDLVATVFAMDFDTPGHQLWTPETRQKFLDDLHALAARGFPYAENWTLLYTTRSGARLVWVLEQPLAVDEAEARHRWLAAQFTANDIVADASCSDWTRIFRLPFVQREGEDRPTWEYDPPVIFERRPDNRMDAHALGSLLRAPTTTYAVVEAFTDPKPLPDCFLRVTRQASPNGKGDRDSDWFREAKSRLKGRDCYPCLFEHKPIAPPDGPGRNNAIHQHVGQAISLLYYFEGTTAEHVYALFLPAVEQLEPDADTADWTDVLWSAVGRNWAKEAAKKAAADAEKIRRSEDAADVQQRMLEGMKRWCLLPELHGDAAQAMEWMHQRLIVSVNNNFHVMLPNGHYDAMPLSQQQLIARIRALGMDKIIPIRVPTEAGAWRDVSPASIINNHATIVRGIRAVPSIEGGFIENIDSRSATLVVPSYARNPDLEPKYDAEVDEWLKRFFSGAYERICEWIAWSLAFEEGPICALSISGGQGVGKKMLIQGLAETLITPRTASADDIVGTYQYGLLDSPFVVVNEGWPKQGGGRHPADQFRALVSGDPIRAQQKFLAPVVLNAPVRIIITANNLDVVRTLAGSRDLSPEDRDALAIRLLHVDVTDEASHWLRAKGGMRFTGRAGRRWIAGDGNAPTDYVVARHFLWLYANRKTPPGIRFLVEGNNRHDIVFEMRTQSGVAPLVIEAVIAMVESKGGQPRHGMHKIGGRLFLLINEVLDYFRQNMGKSTHERITAQNVSNVFRSIGVQGSGELRTLPGREAMGGRRWHELDCKLLLQVAQRIGWRSSVLESLVIEQQRRGSAEVLSGIKNPPLPGLGGGAVVVPMKSLSDRLGKQNGNGKGNGNGH